YDESDFKWGGQPADDVQKIALNKNKNLRWDKGVIISADTIVVDKNEIIGKPKNFEHAKEILQRLSNRKHDVYSGLCVSYQNMYKTTYSKTSVTLNKLSDSFIDQYIDKVGSLHKAGGCSIEGYGYLAFSSIQGCYYNVMGLPIHSLISLFKQMNIHFDHLY
ncbi:Maf family protein, partial [Chlamydiia bacterium]|nr:Maf family protein [Chlamydiia bacterium]